MVKKIATSFALASLIVTSMSAESVALPGVATEVELTKDETTNKSEVINYKIKFKKGWTLFGIPGYKAYKAQDVLGDKDYIEKIYYYDNKNNAWETFDPETKEGKASMLTPGVGYWVYSSKPFKVEFKTNIPSNADVYEKVAVRLGKKEGDLSDDDYFPPMPIDTADYDETWDDDGGFKENFEVALPGVDWDNYSDDDFEQFSESSWEQKIHFDMGLLVDSGFLGSGGNKFRFRPDGYSALEVAIETSGGDSINGKATIDPKSGYLKIEVPGEDPIKYSLIDIEDTDTGIVIKLKNPDNDKPNRWELVEIYNVDTQKWVDALSFFAKDYAGEDEDLKDFDWDNLGEYKDDALDFIKDGYVPTCPTTGEPLPQRADGSYPFPEDADWPHETCPMDIGGANYTAGDNITISGENCVAPKLVETYLNTEIPTLRFQYEAYNEYEFGKYFIFSKECYSTISFYWDETNPDPDGRNNPWVEGVYFDSKNWTLAGKPFEKSEIGKTFKGTVEFCNPKGCVGKDFNVYVKDNPNASSDTTASNCAAPTVTGGDSNLELAYGNWNEHFYANHFSTSADCPVINYGFFWDSTNPDPDGMGNAWIECVSFDNGAAVLEGAPCNESEIGETFKAEISACNEGGCASVMANITVADSGSLSDGGTTSTSDMTSVATMCINEAGDEVEVPINEETGTYAEPGDGYWESVCDKEPHEVE